MTTVLENRPQAQGRASDTAILSYPLLSNRSVLARSSATLANRHAARSIFEPITSRADLAIVLYESIPAYRLEVGDIVLLNKTIAPRAGDKVALLYPDGVTNIVDFTTYQSMSKGTLNLAAVVLGFIRSLGEA